MQSTNVHENSPHENQFPFAQLNELEREQGVLNSKIDTIRDEFQQNARQNVDMSEQQIQRIATLGEDLRNLTNRINALRNEFQEHVTEEQAANVMQRELLRTVERAQEALARRIEEVFEEFLRLIEEERIRNNNNMEDLRERVDDLEDVADVMEELLQRAQDAQRQNVHVLNSATERLEENTLRSIKKEIVQQYDDERKTYINWSLGVAGLGVVAFTCANALKSSFSTSNTKGHEQADQLMRGGEALALAGTTAAAYNHFWRDPPNISEARTWLKDHLERPYSGPRAEEVNLTDDPDLREARERMNRRR